MAQVVDCQIGLTSCAQYYRVPWKNTRRRLKLKKNWVFTYHRLRSQTKKKNWT